jgi:hypothetical protein
MRRLNQCFDPKLAEIIHKTLKLKELNDKVAIYLPKSLQPHVSVGHFHLGCLLLVTTDPVWASQLRYHLPELRENLRKTAGIYELASIKISVFEANHTITKHPQKRYFKLSNKAQETILAQSQYCQYQPLKDALENLVSRAKESTRF